MNNIYTVVPCRTYKVTATEACTLTDGHGLTLELTPGEAQTFEAHTAEIHATAPVALEVTAPTAGKYVTVQVLGVKKIQETMAGTKLSTRFEPTASVWSTVDPQGPVVDMLTDCGLQCEPGWLFRNLWEKADGQQTEVNVGWEFVLLADEEEYLLPGVRAFAQAIELATDGANTLLVKKIYHD